MGTLSAFREIHRGSRAA